jgi:hypothetical protein
MRTDLKDKPLEDQLRIYQRWLERHEADKAIHAKRRAEYLEKTSDRNKAVTARQFEKAEAREDHDISELKLTIAGIEAQIAERDGEARKRTKARVWLDAAKRRARASWLDSGGTLTDFEVSWPEIERQLLLEDTLETLAIQPGTKRAESSAQQPEPFGKRKNWGSRKPPQDPRLKKRTG